MAFKLFIEPFIYLVATSVLRRRSCQHINHPRLKLIIFILVKPSTVVCSHSVFLTQNTRKTLTNIKL